MNRTDLEPVGQAGILCGDQGDHLATFYAQRPDPSPGFTFVYVLYYLFGVIAIGNRDHLPRHALAAPRC